MKIFLSIQASMAIVDVVHCTTQMPLSLSILGFRFILEIAFFFVFFVWISDSFSLDCAYFGPDWTLYIFFINKRARVPIFA